MKKLFAVLILFLVTAANADVVFFESGSPSPGTAFTEVPTFVPNPAYTQYLITVNSELQGRLTAGQYKYTSITTAPVLKDSNGNVISTTWNHGQTTLGGATIDFWQTSTWISGLTNGSPYTITISGNGISPSGSIIHIPFLVAIAAQ
jgi:hypothetical protein